VPKKEDHRTCGPECPYRGLYEGSQASLSDMARRQADALSRVGRLRNALVLSLKRHFPEKFSRAESGFGGRLSDADDEVLLAYLTAFLGASPLDAHLQAASGLHELRTALESIGVRLHGDEPTGWARQIRELGIMVRPTADKISHERPTDGLPSDHTARSLGNQGPVSSTPAQPGPSLGNLFLGESPDESNRLGALFEPSEQEYKPRADAEMTLAAVVPAVPSGPTPIDDRTPLLGDLFLNPPSLGRAQDQTGRWNPSPLLPMREPEDHMSGRQPVNIPDIDHTDSPSNSMSGIAFQTNDATVTVGDGSRQGRTDEQYDAVRSDSITDGLVPPSDPDRRGDVVGSTPPSHSGWVDPLVPGARMEQPEVAVAPASGDEVAAGVTTEKSDTESQTVGQDGGGQGPVHTPAGGTNGPGYGQPLRPELFTPTKPSKTSRRTTRTVRQRAERPDATLLDIPVDQVPVQDLPTDLRARLTDAALLPRPVFTSDLIAIAGSSDTIAAWESDLRATPASSPVRFLAAKGRHRLRGSLVVPVTRSNTEKSGRPNWWADCVERYRGARLYELGVLLHRIGDEVVSAQFEEHGALLRLNTARGIVGTVVLFESLSTDPAASNVLETMLKQLLGERCSLVAILTTSGEAAAVTLLGEAIGRLAVTNGWRPQFPVITARSWEFADDRGSTAQLVLGG
jgi:hypothetical protein